MANTLQLVLAVDNRAGNQAIGQFNQSLGSIERAAARVSGSATRSIGGIDGAAVRVAASVRQTFGGLGAALGVAGFAAVSKSVFDLAAGFERSRIGLKAFLGDAQAADALFKDIQAFAERSPFEFKDLLRGGQRLLAFKTQAQDVVPTLRAISATIGAIGGDQGNFDALIKALGDIRNRGRVTGEELRQLSNQGVPALEFLAKGFGTTTAEIQKAVEQGIVPAEAAIRSLVRGMTEQFGAFDDEVGRTASVALSNFKDTVQRLVADVVRDYLPAITKGINDLRVRLGEFAVWIKENRGTVESLAKGIAGIAAAIVTSKVITGINDLRLALIGLNAAALANPFVLLATGLAFVTFEAYRTQKAFLDLKATQLDDGVIRGLLRDGKTVQELEALGFTAERVKQAISGRSLDTQDFAKAAEQLRESLGGLTVGSGSIKPPAGVEQFNTAMRDAEELARRRADAEKQAANILDQARRGEVEGIQRILETYRQRREEIGLTKKALEDLAAAQRIDVLREAARQGREIDEADAKAAAELARLRMEANLETFRQERELTSELVDLRHQNLQSELGLREAILAQQRDAELRAAEDVTAQTVDQKIAVERRKADIEVQFLEQVQDLKHRMLDADEAIDLARAGQNADLRLAIEQRYNLARQALDHDTNAAIAAARENLEIRTGQMVLDQNQRVFDQFKRQAEGVFDALVRTADNGWKAIANSLKTALLTAIKDVVTSRVAQLLFGLSGGGQVTFAGAGGARGGLSLGSLLGLGATPVFGGGGILGGPGGTSGIAGPVNLGGAAQNLGFLATLKAIGTDFKGILTQLGALGQGGARAATGAAGSALPTGGIGGPLGGALLLGGGILGFSGIRQGGFSGFLQTTAAGALIGAKFGGPVGALIGGGVGALTGLIGLFRESAEEKIVKRVREIYKVDIPKKYAKDPLLGIIKSQFGGNIDIGLRSAPVRELIELYAMATGQNSLGIVNRPVPSVFSNQGGVFAQVPTSQNGQQVFAGAQAASAAPARVSVQLDGPATTAFLQGQTVEAIASSPRAVATANAAGQRTGAGRRESWAGAMRPGYVSA